MSDTTPTDNNTEDLPEITPPDTSNMQMVTFPCARIAWPAFDCDYGHMEAREYDIEPTITGRIDIWKCSVSEANPDGYFLSIADANNSYIGCEPGDLAHQKHLLCKVILTGVPAVTLNCCEEEIARNHGRSFHVEYWNPRLPVQPNPDELCPPPVRVPANYTSQEPLAIGEEPPPVVEEPVQEETPAEPEQQQPEQPDVGTVTSSGSGSASPANAFAAEAQKLQNQGA